MARITNDTPWTIEGKTILITGGTEGIGKETTRVLVAKGARVIIVSHNPVVGAAFEDEVRSINGEGTVIYLKADLSLKREVKRLVKDLLRRKLIPDVLINNVGGMYPYRELTREGIERTFAVNHLGTFLLNILLLPHFLLKTTPSRIIMVNSVMHRLGRVNLKDINYTHEYTSWNSYANAKLASLLCAYRLSCDLENSLVTINIADPGFAVTSRMYNLLLQGVQAMPNLLPYWAMLQTNFTVSEASRPIIYLAESPRLSNTNGKYFDRRKRIIRSCTKSYSWWYQDRMWELSEELAGLREGERLQSITQP